MAKLHRTYWIVRQRYRRTGYVGALIAACLCAFYLVPSVYSAQPAQAGDPFDVWTSVGIFALAVILPPILARLLWWAHRGKYIEDMYRITTR